MSREAKATANRARMRAWSPEFYGLVEQLQGLGMFGKVCNFTTTVGESQ